jgi:hypothetical protein
VLRLSSVMMKCSTEEEMPYEITGSNSGAAEDSSLLACNDVSFGE